MGVKSTRRGDRSVFQGDPRWFKPSGTLKKARTVPETAWDVSEKSAKLARERPPSSPKSAKMAEKWPKMAFFGGDWWGSNRPHMGDRSVFQGDPRWFKPSGTLEKANMVPEPAPDTS